MNPTDQWDWQNNKDETGWHTELRQDLRQAILHDLQSGLVRLMVGAQRIKHEASTGSPDLKRIAMFSDDMLFVAQMLDETCNNLRDRPLPRTQQPFDAVEVARRIVHILTTKAKEMGIDVRMLVDEAPVMVTASEPLLRQVLDIRQKPVFDHSVRSCGYN